MEVVLQQEREYLTIQILHNDMIVNVPTENAERVGLRKVIDERMVEQVLEVLHGNGTTMPKNWNRRFKYNRDKMKTGDIFELAEVVRNLSLREQEKGLSTGEKQMFVKAKKILASELMYAKDMDEDETAEWLDEVLIRSRTRPRSPEPTRGPDPVSERLGGPRRGRRGRAARRRAAEGVRAARRPAASGGEPRAARGFRAARRDRRRRARRLGGARHPPRRGDRRGKGRELRHGWLDAAPAPFAAASRRFRTRRP